jgi:hypothetical protein
MPEETYRLSRTVSPFERDNPRAPIPPINVTVAMPDRGVIDLRWDNPALLLGNQKFTILGVNIYRAYDSEFSGYEKVNDSLLGSTFYRDQNENVTVIDEDVSSAFLARGTDHPTGLWVLRPQHYPLVKAGSQAVPADHPRDVRLLIDGVEVQVQAVNGYRGEVTLIAAKTWNPVTKTLVDPVLPTVGSTVLLSYRYNKTVITSQVNQRIFYKVTTVGRTEAGDLIESPLSDTKSNSAFEIEKLDYIWAEAIRRNRWILEQGGEAVKVFVRKWVGEHCKCRSPDHKQGENDCLVCYGTGIVGGYEGPFDILIAPQDGERTVELTENGLSMMQQYEVWTGPTPMLSQRDFIVRQNNDRYSIGPVNMPSNRGNVLQQHFSIGYIPEKDVRYALSGVREGLRYPQTRIHAGWERPGVEGTVYPQVTHNTNVGEEKVAAGMQERGRTPTYGRIVR